MLFERKKSMLYKMALSFMIIALLPILVISFYFYPTNSGLVREKMAQNNYHLLKKIQLNIDMQMDSVNKIPREIQNNESLKNYSLDKNNYNSINASKEVGKHINTNAFISDAFVYIYKQQRLYGKASSYSKNSFGKRNYIYPDWPQKEMYETLENINEDMVRGSEPIFLRDTTSPGRFITCLFPIPKGNQFPYGVVMVLIEEKEITGLVKNTIKDFPGSGFLILDNKGHVIVNSVSNLPSHELSKILDYTDDFSPRAANVLTIMGEEYLISSIKSDSMDWKYFFFIPLNSSMGDVIRLQHNAILILLGVIILELIFGLIFLKSNYKPIRNVLNYIFEVPEIADLDPTEEDKLSEMARIQEAFSLLSRKNLSLNQELRDNTPAVKESLIDRLISGHYHDVDEIISKCSQHRVYLNHPYYIVCLLKIVGEYQVSNRALFKTLLFIEDEIERSPKNIRIYFTPDMRKNHFIALVNCSKTDIAMINETMERVSTVLKHSHDLEVIIGIGNFQEGIRGLHTNYMNANYTLEYLMVKGHKNIQRYEDIVKDSYDSGSYPFELTYDIKFSILKKDRDKLGRNIETAAEYIRAFDSPFHMVKLVFADTMALLLRSLPPNPEDLDAGDIISLNPFVTFKEYSADEMASMVLEYGHRLMAYYEDEPPTEPELLIKNILSFIQDNLTSPDLSLISIADRFDMSGSNLSHFFKNHTGYNLSAYITTQKMEKAMIMLSETDMSIEEIAQILGYSNASNFGRPFKKITGFTPGEYRAIHGSCDT